MFRVPKKAKVLITNGANGCVWIDFPITIDPAAETENVVTIKVDRAAFLAAVDEYVNADIAMGRFKDASHA